MQSLPEPVQIDAKSHVATFAAQARMSDLLDAPIRRRFLLASFSKRFGPEGIGASAACASVGRGLIRGVAISALSTKNGCGVMMMKDSWQFCCTQSAGTSHRNRAALRGAAGEARGASNKMGGISKASKKPGQFQTELLVVPGV